MLVSVITPSYNQAAFLEDTLRSVLQQTDVQIEHWVMDGGSTDGSVDIIRRYAGQLAGWVSQPDGGQADAINQGLRRAQGEIVAWLNSDDVYLPGAVSRAVAALQANPQAGMVFGDALTVDPAGRPLNRLRFGPWGLDELLRFRIICQPAVFMRRSLLEQAGYLDDSYHFMLDHHLWLKLARLAPPVYIGAGVYAPLAAARHHPAAKNLALAGRVGGEIERILAWMAQQPDLQPRLTADRQRIHGGAYRLAARYALEGGYPGLALRQYARALRYWPGYTLQHTHRMAYAALLLLGLRAPLEQRRAARAAANGARLAAELRQQPLPGLEGADGKEWPGLCLD